VDDDNVVDEERQRDGGGDGGSLAMVGSHLVDVADVAALHVTSAHHRPAREREVYLVAVAGAGLQLLEVELKRTRFDAL
jgi:hypothetical protein